MEKILFPIIFKTGGTKIKNMKNKNILLIIIFYLCIVIILNITNYIFYNAVNTLFWILMLIYLIWDIKNSYIRFKNNIKYITYMIIISAIHIIIYLYTGFLLGFSKSPYSHQILTILINILPKIIIIFGIEITRTVMVLRNKNNKKLLVFITILLILAEVNFNMLITTFPDKELLFKYICSTIIPLITCNVLYTYLTLNCSYLIVIIYRLCKELTVFLLPILPNTDWFVTGTFETLLSAIIYFIFKYKFFKEKNHVKEKIKNLFEEISYIITFILLFSLICFMLGLFKYESISILSNSMAPYFNRGDVVIFKKINDSDLRNIPKNSIIIYSIGGQNVAHRIVDKIEKNNNVLYQTKGDNNNISDMKLVKINQIKGVYVFHIKYIGFPSIWLYEYFNNEKAELEIK